MGSIVTMKKEIQCGLEFISVLEYSLSEKEKMVLDEFFAKSSDRVIMSLLEKYGAIVKDETRSAEFHNNYFPRKKFKLFTPGIKFPNSFHDHEVLYYLESKYSERFAELGLDEIGITNPRFVPSFGSAPDELGLKYSSHETGRFFKDTAINYNLEVNVDCRRKKGKEYIKTTS